MNIGFDAKRLFLNNTGLGNYSRYILDALIRYRPNDHFYLYTPKLRPNKRTEQYIGHASIDIIQPPKNMQLPVLNAWWRSSLMVNHESFSTLDIYHGLSHELPLNIPSHIKKFVTIHDLIFYRYPAFYSPIDVITYKQKVKSACLRADKVMAISDQTANDIAHYLHIPEDKITVVYQGCHDQFRQVSTQEEKNRLKEKYHLPKKFILNISTIEERKNTIGLIKAYARIPSEYSIPLVIVGRATSYIKKVKSLIQ
jgi:glycosyltransferase involved in cell wall biosynthesis